MCFSGPSPAFVKIKNRKTKGRPDYLSFLVTTQIRPASELSEWLSARWRRLEERSDKDWFVWITQKLSDHQDLRIWVLDLFSPSPWPFCRRHTDLSPSPPSDASQDPKFTLTTMLGSSRTNNVTLGVRPSFNSPQIIKKSKHLRNLWLNSERSWKVWHCGFHSWLRLHLPPMSL